MSARGRHYEFAEKWEGTVQCFCWADTQVRPYGKWQECVKSTDTFFYFCAHNWVKRCILWQRRSIRLRTVWVSLRRGGPMCPPVVGITNSPKNGREPYSVSAGRTHGSAPTAGGENGRKVPDVFCPFSAHNWVKRCILWQRRSIRLRTVWVSLRRGGPMCPPVVGITNSPKNGREPYGVSAGRTHRSAPTASGKDGGN